MACGEPRQGVAYEPCLPNADTAQIMLSEMVFASRAGSYLFPTMLDLGETDSSCCLDVKHQGKAVNKAL